MPYAPVSAKIATPIGMVVIAAENETLLSVRIISEISAEQHDTGSPVLDRAVTQMRAYFAGQRRDFDLPLMPLASVRGTALRAGIISVGYGQTLTYGALAHKIDSGPRAVGQACRRNPFPIVVPCHRITSAGSAPENYSGGDGITTKAWLNAFERGNRA